MFYFVLYADQSFGDNAGLMFNPPRNKSGRPLQWPPCPVLSCRAGLICGRIMDEPASDLIPHEQGATPWPPSYKAPQLPMYDGHSDPKQFLMSYEATISSYGGNTAVMAKSFVMAVKSVAQTWYSSLRPGTITSWQKLSVYVGPGGVLVGICPKVLAAESSSTYNAQ